MLQPAAQEWLGTNVEGMRYLFGHLGTAIVAASGFERLGRRMQDRVLQQLVKRQNRLGCATSESRQWAGPTVIGR